MSNEQEYTRMAVYHILVNGRIDQKWTDWLGGTDLASVADDETLLRIEVADQAALHGVLDRINDLGLILLVVVRDDHLWSNKILNE